MFGAASGPNHSRISSRNRSGSIRSAASHESTVALNGVVSTPP